AGMVLVDAVHEDQHIVYGGAAHLIRAEARGRAFPSPHIRYGVAAHVARQRGTHEPRATAVAAGSPATGRPASVAMGAGPAAVPNDVGRGDGLVARGAGAD